jgi:hypothetical protein
MIFQLPGYDKYSDTQKRILQKLVEALLTNSGAVTKKEMAVVLDDPQQRPERVMRHINSLRRDMKIHSPGYYISGEMGIYKQIRYRLVRLIHIAE